MLNKKLRQLIDDHRGFSDNLKFRENLRLAAKKDADVRGYWWAACRADPVVFFNTACWIFEPRNRYGEDGVLLPKEIPFITWPHQDEAIDKIMPVLGNSDIGVEKSRGEGASWAGVLLATHSWTFDPMSIIGLVSKDLNAADNPDDPDSLMWKITWELTMLPTWMVGKKDVDWKRDRSRHTLTNLRNGASITAYAATGDVASGGRKKFFLMDELAKFPRGPDEEAMASTQHVTDSRLVVSTPKGAEGAYYELMHEPSNMIKIVLSWEDNPTKNRGLYRYVKEKPVAIDPVNNPLPKEYDPPTPEILDMFSRLRAKGFRLEGRVRSPWYDRECDRPRATPQSVAQELDRDYGGSSYLIFGSRFMDVAKEKVRPPFSEGELTGVGGEYHFQETAGGPVKLWCSLDAQGRPPRSLYVFGADVSSGLGGSYTSNSVISGLDAKTGEQVLEYATNIEHPLQFTDKCLEIVRWFHDAYFAWEHQGPGYSMTARVRDVGYANVFRRKTYERRSRAATDSLGWWMTPATKEKLFMDASPAVQNGELVPRSKSLVHEFGQYVRINGKIENINSARAPDDSSGQAHGDRVIAFLIAYQAVLDRPLEAFQKKDDWGDEGEPPPGTLARRMWDWDQSNRKPSDPWDRRTSRDLVMGA